MNRVPRRHERADLELGAKLSQGDACFTCHVVNISAGGARLKLQPGTERRIHGDVVLEVESFGAFPATTVWCTGGQVGIQFHNAPESMAEVVMGLAIYSR